MEKAVMTAASNNGRKHILFMTIFLSLPLILLNLVILILYRKHMPEGLLHPKCRKLA